MCNLKLHDISNITFHNKEVTNGIAKAALTLEWLTSHVLMAAGLRKKQIIFYILHFCLLFLLSPTAISFWNKHGRNMLCSRGFQYKSITSWTWKLRNLDLTDVLSQQMLPFHLVFIFRQFSTFYTELKIQENWTNWMSYFCLWW